MMENYPNVLLVSGTTRNVGKTTFICDIIKKVSPSNNIVAVKITPHFHELTPTLKVLYESTDLLITEELSKDINKDSAKMLAAGAKQVFYIQAKDEKLFEGMNFLFNKIATKTPVIIESGGLHKFIKPGLFILMNKTNINTANKKNQYSTNPDIEIIDFTYNIETFVITEKGWELI